MKFKYILLAIFDNFTDKESNDKAYNILILLYKDILNYKIGRKLEYYAKKYYDDDEITDQNMRLITQEIIREKILLKEVTLQGVMSIVMQENPAIIEEKLVAYLKFHNKRV